MVLLAFYAQKAKKPRKLRFSTFYINSTFLSFWFLEAARICCLFKLLDFHVEKMLKSPNKQTLTQRQAKELVAKWLQEDE